MAKDGEEYLEEEEFIPLSYGNLKDRLTLDNYEGRHLWRYMDIYEFLNIIEKNELYFTNLTLFEDSYESSLSEELKIILENELVNLKKQDIYTNKIDHNKLFQALEKGKSNHYVNCWSSSKDNYGLWNIYSKNRKYGIAIQTTIKRLCQSIDSKYKYKNNGKYYMSEGDVFITGSKVIYSLEGHNFFDTNNQILNLDMNAIICYKTLNYEYEQEFRLCLADLEKEDGKIIKINTDKLIEKWIPSPFMPQWFIDDVLMKLLDKYGLSQRYKKSNIKLSKIDR